MDLIKLVEAVRAELYPGLKLVKVSAFPVRKPMRALVSASIDLFPYIDIWDKTLTVEYQEEKPLSTLVEMLRLERYLFRDVELIAYIDKLWTYEYDGRPMYVIRCAQVNKE